MLRREVGALNRLCAAVAEDLEMSSALGFYYYCDGPADSDVARRLEEIKTRYGVNYEIVDLSTNGQHDLSKNREIYERIFKPRAKVLKRRTSESITSLRSRRAGRHNVSTPGTFAVVRDRSVEWFCIEKAKTLDLLNAVWADGTAAVERLLR